MYRSYMLSSVCLENGIYPCHKAILRTFPSPQNSSLLLETTAFWYFITSWTILKFWKMLCFHNVACILDVIKLIYSLREEKINRWSKAAVNWITIINQHIDSKQIRCWCSCCWNRTLPYGGAAPRESLWATAAAAMAWRDICNFCMAMFLI